MWKVVHLEKYFDFSLYSHHFSLLSLTSLLSAPEREVTSPSDFKVVGALLVSDLRQVDGFLHQKNGPPRYNWNNIVESGSKHHKPKPN
jgi:hypothetical protein